MLNKLQQFLIAIKITNIVDQSCFFLFGSYILLLVRVKVILSALYLIILK